MADLSHNLDTVVVAEQLLISGFLRSINHSKSLDIPPLIYANCVTYRLGSAQYLWTVDKSILHQMKMCRTSEGFTSPIFEIEGLLWQLEAYPTGRYDSSEGDFELIIKPIRMPLSWRYINCAIRMQCLETMTTYVRCDSFDIGQGLGWMYNVMKHSEIQSLDHLSFGIEIIINQIVLKEANRVFYELDIMATDQAVEWKIDRKILEHVRFSHIGKQFYSPIYGGMYSIGMVRRELDVSLRFKQSAKLAFHKSATVYGTFFSGTFEMLIKSSGVETVDRKTITSDSNDYLTDSGSHDIDIFSIPLNRECDSLLVKGHIKVHHNVDDVENKKAIDYWTKVALQQNDSNLPQTIEQRMDSLESTMEKVLADVKAIQRFCQNINYLAAIRGTR